MEKEGFEVVTVYNGSKALEVFRERGSKHCYPRYYAPGGGWMAGLQGDKKNQQYSGDYAFAKGRL